MTLEICEAFDHLWLLSIQHLKRQGSESYPSIRCSAAPDMKRVERVYQSESKLRSRVSELSRAVACLFRRVLLEEVSIFTVSKKHVIRVQDKGDAGKTYCEM